MNERAKEKRARADRCETPSEVFRRYFGPEHGVEMPAPRRYAYRKVEFTGESEP